MNSSVGIPSRQIQPKVSSRSTFLLLLNSNSNSEI